MSVAAPLTVSDKVFGREATQNQDTLKVMLSTPVEFQETGAGHGMVQIQPRWQEVNPLPKAANSTNQPSSSISSLAAAASSSKPVTLNGKKTKTLYSGAVTQSFPSGSSNVGTGFNNTGNTCYLNSVLQALVHTPGLAKLLDEHPPAKECAQKKSPKSQGYCAACNLRAVYQHSFLKSGNSYIPSVFTNNLKQVAKHLRKGRQEDSHEFLRFLVDGIQNAELIQHGDPAKIPAELKYTTSIHQLFGGRLRSRVTCSRCQHPSDTFDAFLDLSIEVKKCSSVKAGFEKFIAKDKLDGSNKYKCEKCKSLQVATKQLTIFEPPKALVVHLKRFGPLGGKINGLISYDKTFDISPYMSQGQQGARYRLYALVLHSGSGPNSGHYTARVLSLDGTRWYSMDDSFVSSLGANAPLHLKDAYLLLYVREKGDALSQAVGNGGGGVKSKLKNPFIPPLVSSTEEQEEEEKEDGNAEAGPSRARAASTSVAPAPSAVKANGKKRRHSDIALAPEEDDDDSSAPSAFSRLTSFALNKDAPSSSSSRPTAAATPSRPDLSSHPLPSTSSSTTTLSQSSPLPSSEPSQQHALTTPQLSKTARKKARKAERKSHINPYNVGVVRAAELGPAAGVGGGGGGGGEKKRGNKLHRGLGRR